jgi:hypothetical protein
MYGIRPRFFWETKALILSDHNAADNIRGAQRGRTGSQKCTSNLPLSSDI